jgi:methylmalonyl-CoA mutase
VQDCQQNVCQRFDSVTLYGNDPHVRPDIYGKIAEFLLLFDDAKKLYSGLIWSCHDFSEYDYNGPAPMLLVFMNAN